jgi:hypothetical protein
MMTDRRRYKRFKVDLIDINGKMVFATNVKIIDISLGGVSLKVDRRLNMGSEYTLTVSSKGKVFSIKCIVVWSFIKESVKDSRGNIVPIYTAGMQFKDASNEKIKEIVAFIEDHKLDVIVDLHGLSGQRLNVRVQIKAPDNAVLNFHEHYKVKKLGLGGMQIESAYELGIDQKFPMKIIFYGDKAIQFLGRVTSCLLVKNRGQEHYNIGIEFLDMSEHGREILHEFIRSLEDKGSGLNT